MKKGFVKKQSHLKILMFIFLENPHLYKLYKQQNQKIYESLLILTYTEKPIKPNNKKQKPLEKIFGIGRKRKIDSQKLKKKSRKEERNSEKRKQ